MLIEDASLEGQSRDSQPAALQCLRAGSAWLRTSVVPLTAVIALLCLGAWLTGWEVVRYIDDDRTQFFLRHKTHPILLHNTIGGGKQFRGEDGAHQLPAGALGAVAPPDSKDTSLPAAPVAAPAVSEPQAAIGEEAHPPWNPLRPRAGWNMSLQQEGSHPKIYILPISQQFTCKEDPQGTRASRYGAEVLIPEALAASNYTTADPAEADLFFVPAHLHCRNQELLQHPEEMPALAGPGINAQALAREALKHVQSEFPFYEPQRAVWAFVENHGACGSQKGGSPLPELAQSVLLSHWGLSVPEVHCDWWTRLHNYNSCPKQQGPGTSQAGSCFVPNKDVVVAHPTLDTLEFVDPAAWGIPGLANRTVMHSRPMTVNATLLRGIPRGMPAVDEPAVTRPGVAGPRFTFPLLLWEGRLAAYPTSPEDRAKAAERLAEVQQAALDLPEAEYRGAFSVHATAWRKEFGSELQDLLQAMPPSGEIRREKAHILFFRGGIEYGDPAFSRGALQAAVDQLRNASGVAIQWTADAKEEDTRSILQEMGRSHFCLATTGAGWGSLLKQALVAGCVPVVVAKDVQMEFEDVLPYKDFAVRVAPHALYMLPQFLTELLQEPGLVDAMSQRGVCAWRYLSWHPQHGRALQALMCSLRRRLWGRENVLPAMDWERCELSCLVAAGRVSYEREASAQP